MRPGTGLGPAAGVWCTDYRMPSPQRHGARRYTLTGVRRCHTCVRASMPPPLSCLPQHLCAYEIGWAHYFQLNWEAAIPQFQRCLPTPLPMHVFVAMAVCELPAPPLPTCVPPPQAANREHVEQGLLCVHGGGGCLFDKRAPLKCPAPPAAHAARGPLYWATTQSVMYY